MDIELKTPRQIGAYVKAERTRRGISRARLAELAGVSAKTVFSLEAGQAEGINLDKLMSILGALDLKLMVGGLSDEVEPFLMPRLD